jgi:FtsP/CotA-like multicopper oxidase with cupredoxin domain
VTPTPSRRQFLAGGAVLGTGAAALGAGAMRDPPGKGTGAHHRMEHGGGVNGPSFRAGATVDHSANGFHPSKVLRDFDYGQVSTTPDGRTVRQWDVFAADREVEVAPGVRFPAWTFNSRIPGPTLRCREGDLLRVRFVNGSAPFGLHLYHCHVGPLAEHIARGMYGTFIIDPPRDRPPADELVMVMHGYNTTFDGQSNQLYAVNGIPFHYMHEPVRVRRGELVRIYLINILEYDPINSFHIHGNFFDYYPTGTRLRPTEFTDTVVQGQGQRGICELRFPHPGRFMFHSHKTEFADLGWMGFFEVT